MSTLDRAIAIAAEAHAKRADTAGAPYILHARRVMLRVGNEAERIAAVRHDVVADSLDPRRAGRLLAVMFTERGPDRVRLVSARPATRSERRVYEEGFG